MEGLKVGDVARQAGVNPQTIHFYERRGLLPAPRRTVANYRMYPEDAVRRVRFIKRAQELGFTLKEVRELLSLRVGGRVGCAEVLERAEAKVQDIDGKIETLQAMRKALKRLMRACSGRGPLSECPILEALDSEGGSACCESS